MIALGFDPGGRKGLSWGLYDSDDDSLTCGTIRTEDEEVVWAYAGAAEDLIEQYAPTIIAVELQQVKRLPKHVLDSYGSAKGGRDAIYKLAGVLNSMAAAALDLAQVVGAIKVIAGQAGIRCVGLRQATIKRAMTGKGNASKQAVRDEVLKLYGERLTLVRNRRDWKKNILRQDEADAAATAIAGLQEAER